MKLQIAMDSQELEKEGFHTEFKFNDRQYIADIKYPYPLNEKERELYKVEDGEFLVHLIDEVGSRSFKVFINEEHQWTTDSPSLLIERELVEIIGTLIDSKLA
jgi:hypothetical protein